MFERAALIAAALAALAAGLIAVMRRNYSLGNMRTQFSLRTLLVLMAIGPPLMAAIWSQREVILEFVDRPWGAVRPVNTPAGGAPQRLTPRQATPQSRQQEQEADRQLVHVAAGFMAVVCYPLTVFALAPACSSRHSWRIPRRATTPVYVAIVAAALTAGAGLTFALTHPEPEHRRPFNGREYKPEVREIPLP